MRRNILLDHKMEAKIADMGMARQLGDGDDESYVQISHSPIPIRWSAPESIRLESFTKKSDVWSFGVVLWEIFTLGERPYSGLLNEAILHFLDNNFRLNKPEECPYELYRLMKQCWRKDATERPTFQIMYANLTSQYSSIDENRYKALEYLNIEISFDASIVQQCKQNQTVSRINTCRRCSY